MALRNFCQSATFRIHLCVLRTVHPGSNKYLNKVKWEVYIFSKWIQLETFNRTPCLDSSLLVCIAVFCDSLRNTGKRSKSLSAEGWILRGRLICSSLVVMFDIIFTSNKNISIHCIKIKVKVGNLTSKIKFKLKLHSIKGASKVNHSEKYFIKKFGFSNAFTNLTNEFTSNL